MTFTEWLRTKVEAADPLGTFARDVMSKPMRPRGAVTHKSGYDTWVAFIVSTYGVETKEDSTMLMVFNDAWKTYKLEMLEADRKANLPLRVIKRSQK